MRTASEIVIWMVLAALVGFATGWALRSVVANRARHRLSERLDEKRREAQELREELRHLRGDDEDDVVRLPAGAPPELEGWDADDGSEELRGRGSQRDRRARRGRARAARERSGARRRARRSTARRARCSSTRSSGRTSRTRRAGPTTRRERRTNRDELSPLALLRRSELAYPERTAVRDGERTVAFAELAERSWRLGRALRGLGVEPEQRVAMLSLNRLELLEAHFGAPASRGALCAINTRLAPPEVRFIVEHCGAEVLLLDPELEAAASQAAELPGLRVVRLGAEYEELLAGRLAHAAGVARQRGSPDRRGLHERHDGHAQGRRLHAPRRLSRRARRPRRDAPRAGQHLPLDAADVPLQRLVLHVGGARASARRASCCRGPSRARSGASCAPARRTCARRRRC